jgi:hypothetical protein
VKDREIVALVKRVTSRLFFVGIRRDGTSRLVPTAEAMRLGVMELKGKCK